MSRLIKSSILLFVFSLSFFSLAHAQGIPGVNEPVTLQTSPRFPKPDTTVTITAQSFSTDLNRAGFSWISGGKVIKQGTGVTSVVVPSGKVGILTSVSVTVTTVDIGTISQEVSWRPADVTLVWKSDGYTPPFYRGKALESYGASFRVTAIPEFFTEAGKRIDPKTLVYTWKKNGTIDPNQSGYGKDSFTSSQASYIRGGDDINVEVSNNDGSIIATKTTTISPGIPEIIFYEESPLYGIQYEEALNDTFNLTAEEVTLCAEPFNVSTNNIFAGLNLDWSINGDSVPSFKDKNKITLRKAGAVGGQSAIGLSIQHQTKILQGGIASINIIQ
ncbi:MAG: hypothetical protein Q7R72_02040 [bacterium]|nr:hypothetical protein [bacterium]